MNAAQRAGDPAMAGGTESVRDYREHERTYAGFINTARWFVVHLLFDLVGLYFLAIKGEWLIGLGFILAGTIMLVAGNLMTPKAEAEARSPQRL